MQQIDWTKSQVLIDQLRKHEGVRKYLYNDYTGKQYRSDRGKLTIGIGRNIEDVGLRDDEILYLLTNDIKVVTSELDRNLPWWRELDVARQRVLIDMAFNLGIGKFLSFYNTIDAIKANRFKEASENMLASKWATQVGNRAKKLARVMETGTW